MAEKRLLAIVNNNKYREYLASNMQRERERVYCKHQWEHSIAVARVAYVITLETNTPNLTKDVVYAAGLLHDIARWLQYDEGRDHAEAGAELAVEILEAAGYDDQEIQVICEAIGRHRKPPAHEHNDLGNILYRADKAVRPCRFCEVREGCNKLEQMGIIQGEDLY